MSFNNKLKFLILIILMPAVFTGFLPGKIVVIRALCFFLICFWGYKHNKQFDTSQFDGNICIKLLLLFGTVSYIRGFFNIDDNTDLYNQCSNLIFTSFLLPLYVYLSTPNKICILWKSFLSYGLSMCGLCYFFPPTDGFMTFQQNMMFLNGFLLCIPFVKRKYAYVFLILSLFAVFYDLDRRSVLVGTIVPILLMLSYKFLTKHRIKTCYFVTMFMLPIILLGLGITGKFNVFQSLEELEEYSTGAKTRGLNVDSRTAIYLDVLFELDDQKAFLWGLGGNGKTHTSLSEIAYADYDKIYKNGRQGTESGMLNFIQYGGLFGFFVYTLFFVTVCYYGLYKSNNKFVILIALYACFRYLYSYVEDVFTTNGHTLYNMLLYGICLSKEFRAMDDNEIKSYLQNIFR